MQGEEKNQEAGKVGWLPPRGRMQSLARATPAHGLLARGAPLRLMAARVHFVCLSGFHCYHFVWFVVVVVVVVVL